MEKLAGFLPLHLIAVLVSSDRDEALLRYLLCGIRILHSLCELAPRHTKLEQVALILHIWLFLYSNNFNSLFVPLFAAFVLEYNRDLIQIELQ